MALSSLIRGEARRLSPSISRISESISRQVGDASPRFLRNAESSSSFSKCTADCLAQRTFSGMRDGLRGILPQQHGGNVVQSLHGVTGRMAAGPPRLATGLQAFGASLSSASRGICNPAKEAVYQQTLLQTMPRSPVLQQQRIYSELVVMKRFQSTETLSDKWKSASEKLKQAVFKRPKAAMGIAIRDAGITKPLEGVKNTASRYKEAAGLQVEAFWKRNIMILVGAVGVLSCYLLWRIMFGIANVFVGFSEGMAKFGFLAMAAATVAFAGLILRARFTINPDKVYRIAMRKLNTSPAALEVLGPPLSGTDVRAYVMSSGSLRLKNLKPKFGSKRCFLIFPIRGSERRGLVSAEVKKKKGQYDFKLLAVDVATPGADQRVFIIGDELEYKVGGGLISELRDPIVKAMAAQKEFEEQDEKEEEDEQKEEEARRKEEQKEEEARRKEEIERLERAAAG